jgi:hypothetical protein
MAHFIILSGDNTRDEGPLTSSNCTVMTHPRHGAITKQK